MYAKFLITVFVWIQLENMIYLFFKSSLKRNCIYSEFNWPQQWQNHTIGIFNEDSEIDLILI